MKPLAEISPLPVMSCRADEVDLWQASLDGQSVATLARLRSLLSADEIARAQAFHFERDRRRFMVSRGVLRSLLGRYVGRNPRSLEFHYGANGKPTLASAPGEPPLYFNVSHSGGIALYAITRLGDVGVDVECVRDVPEWAEIAAAHLSTRERDYLATQPPEAQSRAFLLAWTRHEALLKASGAGLAERSAQELENAWKLSSFILEPGAVAAIAVQPETSWLQCRTWADASVDDFLEPSDSRRVRLQFFSEASLTFP